MGILYMASADLQDLSYADNSSGLTISNAQARTGTRSYCSTAGGLMVPAIPLTVEGYIRYAAYVTGAIGPQIVSNDYHFKVVCSPGSVTLEVPRDTVVVAASVPTILANEWNVFEIHWKIAASGGSLEVKHNGIVVAQWLNKDTYYTGSLGVRLLTMGYVTNSWAGYMDDIIIRDDQWPGRGGIYVLTPNAGSTNEGWTSSDASDPETDVEEIPPTFTNYLSTDATVNGTEHTVNVTDLASTPWNIRGVGVAAKIKATASTDAFAHTLLQTGVTKTVGADNGIEVTGQWVRDYYALNPADAAVFEAADITDIEIGIESVVV